MQIVEWIVLGILATTFMSVGYGKISGARSYHFAFIKWRLPQWFRLLTGAQEMLGSCLLIIGIWYHSLALFGAVLLLLVCIGGILVHLKSRDGVDDMLPILLLSLLLIIYFMFLLF